MSLEDHAVQGETAAADTTCNGLCRCRPRRPLARTRPISPPAREPERPNRKPGEHPRRGAYRSRLLRGDARLALAARPSATVSARGCARDLRRADDHADSPDLALDGSGARIRVPGSAHAGATAPIGRCPSGERGGGRIVGPDADTCAPAWRVLAPTRPTPTWTHALPRHRPRARP